MTSLFKKDAIKKVALSFIFLFLVGTFVYATYTPGETLDPACDPGVGGCVVDALLGATSFVGTETFLGDGAGTLASTDHTLFLGTDSGSGATNAIHSIFIGTNAGFSASDANSSIFIGRGSGNNADNSSNSVFIGREAGMGATDATASVFLGLGAGAGAEDANDSIFIGRAAGNNDTVDNSGGATSILIGNATSTGGFQNSIALGAQAANTGDNQLMIGSAGVPISDVVITGTGFTTCSVNTVTGIGISCSSDERLKTNINDLSTDTLEKLINVRAVSYNWKSNPTGSEMVGFLAQDLEQYFPELVSTASNGYKQVNYAGMTPYLVESVRTLNTKVDLLSASSGFSTDTLLVTISELISNVIENIKNITVDLLTAKKIQTSEFCMDDICITRDEFKKLLEQGGITNSELYSETDPDLEEETDPDPESNIIDELAPESEDKEVPAEGSEPDPEPIAVEDIVSE